MKELAFSLIIVLTAFGYGYNALSMDKSDVILVAQNEGSDMPEKKKHDRPPPQEAIEACQAQSVGYTCEFMSPQGDVIQGVCEIMPGDIIACLLDNRHKHQ